MRFLPTSEERNTPSREQLTNSLMIDGGQAAEIPTSLLRIQNKAIKAFFSIRLEEAGEAEHKQAAETQQIITLHNKAADHERQRVGNLLQAQ
jgi:hypothetical protein